MNAHMQRKPKRRTGRKCVCGCGQASAETMRYRKAECRACGYGVRLSREMIARGLPCCPCGEAMECPCLEDRMHAGDDHAYAELLSLDAARFKSRPNVTGRVQPKCDACHKFKRQAGGSCEHCGYDPARGYVEATSAIPF